MSTTSDLPTAVSRPDRICFTQQLAACRSRRSWKTWRSESSAISHPRLDSFMLQQVAGHRLQEIKGITGSQGRDEPTGSLAPQWCRLVSLWRELSSATVWAARGPRTGQTSAAGPKHTIQVNHSFWQQLSCQFIPLSCLIDEAMPQN